MPYAVTHVIITIILVDLFRDYALKHKKKYFTLHTIFLAGFGGLLPDIDLPLEYLLNYLGLSTPLLIHRGITHTPFFALLFLVPGIILFMRKKHKLATYFFVIAFGIFMHTGLDFLFGGEHGIMFFWPLSDYQFGTRSLFGGFGQLIAAGLDAIILLAWLYHEEIKHKIKDFI